MNFEFTLTFQLPHNAPPTEQLVEALAQAGCDDAIIGTGHPARIALEFCREAPSAEKAIESATDDVKRAIPDAALIEAAPDYVGLTEIAEIIGLSRQALRKQMLAHRDFPRPLHCGKHALWHLAPVLEWLRQQDRYRIDSALEETARQTMKLNAQNQQQQARNLQPQTATA